MINFVGLGLCVRDLTVKAIEVMKRSTEIYVENYTSIYSDNELKELEKIIGKNINILYREDVEINFKNIILKAKNSEISFCVFGNITSATTHSTIIKECVEEGIEYRLVPGISILSIVPMLSGLQEYRFGRVVSIVKPLENYSPTSFFDYIIDNKDRGLHTICLLDIKIDKNEKYFMQPYEAAKRIIEIGSEKNIDVKNFECIVIVGANSSKQEVYRTTLDKLQHLNSKYNYPSTIAIVGKLQMDEEEFLRIY